MRAARAPPHHDGQRWHVWLPVALLVLVAGTQIALTHCAGLTAWKGGTYLAVWMAVLAGTELPWLRWLATAFGLG